MTRRRGCAIQSGTASFCIKLPHPPEGGIGLVALLHNDLATANNVQTLLSLAYTLACEVVDRLTCNDISSFNALNGIGSGFADVVELDVTERCPVATEPLILVQTEADSALTLLIVEVQFVDVTAVGSEGGKLRTGVRTEQFVGVSEFLL